MQSRGTHAPSISDGPAPSVELVQARGATWGPNQVWFPFIFSQGKYDCYMDAQAFRLLGMMRNDPGQQRSQVVCNPKLVMAAQHRVTDMNDRRYFSHYDPDGRGPNFWAEYFGCTLPSYYPDNGNSIESIAINYQTLEEVWAAWMASESHRVHLRAQHDSYRRQTHVGIAVLNGQYGVLYAILTAEPC